MDAALKFLGFCTLMVLAIPIALWHAYCLTVIWTWYAPPPLVELLTMKIALGIALGVELLTMRAARKDDPDLSDRIATAVIGPAIALLAGRLFLFFV